jgi:hypothetical protein
MDEKYKLALQMLAEWVCAFQENGSGWYDWDDYYKDAAYRDTPIRKDLDEAIQEARKLFKGEYN